MSTGPNPLAVGLSVAKSLISVGPPEPRGNQAADHSLLIRPLQRLEAEGPASLPDLEPELGAYLDAVSSLDPKDLNRHAALAFWINVYNAGALLLAGRAQRAELDSVLGVPGGFRRKFLNLSGQELSLDDIEHGKLRRLKDPRIHAALVCGSISCPTLRAEPYDGPGIDAELDEQMRRFLEAGALDADTKRNVVSLSRVFLWFGADFARPHRMPTLLPARRRSVLQALMPWMKPSTANWADNNQPTVEFQEYDWGLSCTVR